jgi:hypothetical protein
LVLVDQSKGAKAMQQSDLDLMMLFNVIKRGRTAGVAQAPRRSRIPGWERIRTVVRGRRRATTWSRSSWRPGSVVGR